MMRRRTFLAGAVAVLGAPLVEAVNSKQPRVRLRTARGDMLFELFADRAPITVANFLQYVNGGMYSKGGSFYRVVRPKGDANPTPINVIQGGLRREAASLPGIDVETTRTTGLSHIDGTLSMARQIPDWSSPLAASEFFICIGDNTALDFGGARNSDGKGFAAFGRVIEGMEVVLEIQKLPPGSSMQGTRWAGQVLDEPVRFVAATRIDQ